MLYFVHISLCYTPSWIDMIYLPMYFTGLLRLRWDNSAIARMTVNSSWNVWVNGSRFRHNLPWKLNVWASSTMIRCSTTIYVWFYRYAIPRYGTYFNAFMISLHFHFLHTIYLAFLSNNWRYSSTSWLRPKHHFHWLGLFYRGIRVQPQLSPGPHHSNLLVTSVSNAVGIGSISSVRDVYLRHVVAVFMVSVN